MKRLVLDLDNTITIHGGSRYEEAIPNRPLIEKMRTYRMEGFEIIIATARNMNSYDNNIGKINANTLPIIIDWLAKHDVPYDEIWVGKPWCGHDGFYVDDKAVRPDEFVTLDYSEIQSLIG